MRALKLSCLGLMVFFGCGGSGASPPAAPANVSATAGASQIALSWSAVSGATSYVVLRGTVSGGPYAPLGTPTATSFADPTAQAGTHYFYVVQAVNSAGTSVSSSEVTAFIALPAPAAPTGLTATLTSGQIVLTWTAPAANATGYLLSRGAATGGPYAQIATPTATTYTDASAAPGLTYFYVVAATGEGGTKSPDSAEVSATTAPAAPAGLSAVGASTTITLSWTASAGATSYDVLRADAGLTNFTQIGTSATTGYADSGLANSTSFSYEVRARNAAGASAASSPVAGSTGPAAPTGLTATAGNAKAALSWVAPAGSGLTYRVLRGAAAGGPYTQVATGLTATSATDSPLSNHTAYYYVVRAVNGSGESDDSNEAQATPVRELCVVDSANYQVSVFDADQSGDGAPLRKFGWNTGLQQVNALAVDGTNGEVFAVSTPRGVVSSSIVVFPNTVSAPVAATRRFHDPSWDGFGPTAVLVDAINDEVYVATSNQLAVYPRTASGEVAGPLLSISITGTSALALDPGHSELFAVSGDAATISVFSTATGAPVRTISPALGTSSHLLRGAAYDLADDAVMLLWVDPSHGHVGAFARLPGGATNPVRAPLAGAAAGLIGATGLAVDNSTGKLFVTAFATVSLVLVPSIRQFPLLTATGNVMPAKVISGPSTTLYTPGALAVDTVHSELWSVNAEGLGLASFLEVNNGNVAPAHSLDGTSSGLFAPGLLLADRAHGKILVLNQGPSHSVATYDSTAAGPAVVPLNLLAGPGTSLDGVDLQGFALDAANGEVWVNEYPDALVVFSLPADGDTAPARTPIAGNLTTLNGSRGLDYDPKAQELVVANDLNKTILTFSRTASGDVAPVRTMTGFADDLLATVAVDAVNDEVLVADNLSLFFFPRAFTSGAMPTPLRTFGPLPVAPQSIALDTTVGDLFVPHDNAIYIFARTGTGSVLRTITGASTGLANAYSAAVCN